MTKFYPTLTFRKISLAALAAGLRVTYDLGRPVGRRVRRLEILCSNCSVPQLEPVLDDQPYRVVVPRFIVGGGDGFTMLRDEKLAVVDIGELVVVVGGGGGGGVGRCS